MSGASTRPALGWRVDPTRLVVLALLALVLGVGALVGGQFATPRNLANVLEQAAPLGFISLGQTVVVLVGGIDLSIGALVAALAVLIAALCDSPPDLAWLAIPLALIAGGLVGLLNAGLVIVLRVHSLIATLGVAAVLAGLTLSYTREPTGAAPDWLQEFAFGRVAGVSIAGAVMLACFALAALVLGRHPLGRRLYAVGGNAEAARLSGLSVTRARLAAFAVSGVMAAAAAVYFVARTGTGDPLVGEPLTLASITPVVVGGTVLGGGRGGVLGTLLGVFLIALLGNLLNYLNISTFLQWVVQGLIILFAVGLRAPGRTR